MGLVLIEFFLQRQRVLHCTDGSHWGAHKHHAPRVWDGNGCVDDIKCWCLSKDLERRQRCSVWGAELCSQWPWVTLFLSLNSNIRVSAVCLKMCFLFLTAFGIVSSKEKGKTEFFLAAWLMNKQIWGLITVTKGNLQKAPSRCFYMLYLI